MIPLFKVAMADEAIRGVDNTLRSGYIGEGPRVKEFEEKLSDYLGGTILATNSCTSALDMAYHLIGLKKGSHVISTPMTCLATNMPLALRECFIYWADVNPLTGNIDPRSVEYFVKKGHPIDAIICTDWAGRPCDYDEIRRVAPGIPIVEDAAHAFGAIYNINDPDSAPIAISGGTYVAYSFQAIKHLTTGDGGALKVPEHQRKRARLLRWYGLDREDSAAMRCLQQASEPGFKYQMNDIAASIGLANLQLAADNLLAHKANAYFYSEHLPEGVNAPFDGGASYWIYTILVKDPAKFEEYMSDKGIQVSQVHTRNDIQNCLPSRTIQLVGLDMFQSRMVSIPVGWWLTERDKEDIVAAVNNYVKVPAHVA